MQIVQELPEELAAILFAAGSRRVLLLEGDDDATILSLWYHDRKSSLYFYPARGSSNIIRLLDAFDSLGLTSRIYAIRDRDFRSPDEVRADEDRFRGHLFTLPRYAIENYILEPEAVWHEFSTLIEDFPLQNITAMENKILDIFKRLRPMMAANWVFSERPRESKVRFFTAGHDLYEEEVLVNTAQQKLGIPISETKRLINEKASIIESNLYGIEAAHAYINGKHALHHLHKSMFAGKPGLPKDYLVRLLTRAVQNATGVPDDIRQIVEGEILGI